MTRNTSDFGTGLCYCLGMFLAHTEQLERHLRSWRDDSRRDEHFSTQVWMSGASDHLAQLQIDSAPKHLRARLNRFVISCFRCRRGYDQWTERQAREAIEEAKELLRLLDRAHKVPTAKARYS